jgi:hypothetical protein
MNETVVIAPEALHLGKCSFRVSVAEHDHDLERLDAFATVVVSTGACGVQLYLTPDNCRDLAKMFNAAAVAVEKLAIEDSGVPA